MNDDVQIETTEEKIVRLEAELRQVREENAYLHKVLPALETTIRVLAKMSVPPA